MLLEQGVQAQATSNLIPATDVLVITTALGFDDINDLHWQALNQAREFVKNGGKRLILLQDTSGCFAAGPSNGWHGGMAALAKTAALEWSGVKVQCIDVAVNQSDIRQTAQRLLKAIESELPVVGVDLTGRLCALQSHELDTHALQAAMRNVEVANFKDTDVWLVSGGARGVTANCLVELAGHVKGCFALLGRSTPVDWPTGIPVTDDIVDLRRKLAAKSIEAGERPVPKHIESLARQALAGEEIRRTLDQLNEAGVSARYYACDITDQQSVFNVVANVRSELGEITALIHGAGVLADSLLHDKTQDQLKKVFDTKVGGLKNLLAAIEHCPPAYTALFSSAAAFYGNTGQGDYAMANEILNRVAQSLKQHWPNAVVKSFNWGPWDSGMVDETLARYFEDRGIGLIPVKEGSQLFASEMLAGDPARVELLVGDSWAG